MDVHAAQGGCGQELVRQDAAKGRDADHVGREGTDASEELVGDARGLDHGKSQRKGLLEAINGRLEHLCGSALGFRNFTNCIARSLSLSHRERRCSKPADSDPDHTLDCE